MPLHLSSFLSVGVVSVLYAVSLLDALPIFSLHWLLHSAPPAQGSPAWMVQRPALHLSAPLQNVPSAHDAWAAWFSPFRLQMTKPLHRAALQSLGVVSVHDVVVGLKQLRAVS